MNPDLKAELEHYGQVKERFEAAAHRWVLSARALHPDMPAGDLLKLLEGAMKGMVQDAIRREDEVSATDPWTQGESDLCPSRSSTTSTPGTAKSSD